MGLLAVGSVAYDSVETPFGKEEKILGGSAVHFSASASFFAPVNLVGVVGEDFNLADLDFIKERGGDLRGLQVKPGNTFHWKGRYGFDLNIAETLETHLNVFADFHPELPADYAEQEFVFLGNIHPELQLRVAHQVVKPRLIALDTMNFWIQGARTELIRALGRVDLVVINEGEARELGEESSLVKASRKIRGWMRPDGRKILVVKRGEYGAMLFHDNEVFSAPGLPLEQVMDPTGAGDSFAGGLMGYLAKHGEVTPETLKQGVIVGSAMASFNVEDFSCRRLQQITREQIEARVRQFKNLSVYGEVKI